MKLLDTFGWLDCGHLRWRSAARQRREEGLTKAGAVEAEEGMDWSWLERVDVGLIG